MRSPLNLALCGQQSRASRRALTAKQQHPHLCTLLQARSTPSTSWLHSLPSWQPAATGRAAARLTAVRGFGWAGGDGRAGPSVLPLACPAARARTFVARNRPPPTPAPLVPARAHLAHPSPPPPCVQTSGSTCLPSTRTTASSRSRAAPRSSAPYPRRRGPTTPPPHQQLPPPPTLTPACAWCVLPRSLCLLPAP